MSNRKIPIAIRAHTELPPKEEKPRRKPKPDLRKPYGKRILVFDTETTDDIYMNLRYGQAFIIEGTRHAWLDGQVIRDGHILFYGEGITPDEMKILKSWAWQNGAVLMNRAEFIKIFLDELLIIGSVCVGFNLSFDLPRIAINVKTWEWGKNKDAFELILGDKFMPSILLESLDSKKSFVKFKFPSLPKQNNEAKHWRTGRFLDLRTLVFALTNESHSLSSACRLFKTVHQKTEADEGGYGIISPQNLNYNYNDLLCTGELYRAAMEEYYRHPVASFLEAGKAYSPASIGKAYYQGMNIKPLMEIQPDFPKEVLGYAMASYFGGRAECRYRGIPVKVYHTDILSMYPSVFTLQNLWNWVIAEGFDVQENTEQVKTFLSSLSLNDLFRQETWNTIPGLVQVKPDGDLLPVRAEYADNNQIGLNYLRSETPLWYTLADIVACKILTGKIPEIVKALRIIPKGPQAELNAVQLRGQVAVDPVKDNFFKRVIELRQEFKKQVQEKGDEADSLQTFLKILANSTSYGVYVELNRDESKKELNLQIHGTDSFNFKSKDYENAGKFYNPLIATMITGAARLILAIIQKSVQDLGGDYAFCDTDSMAIIDPVHDRPEEIGRQVIDKFKSLVPYDFGGSLLQAEKVNWNPDKPKEYMDLYCYTVSSKRYVMYNLTTNAEGITEIIIRKQTYHGMGHLLYPPGHSLDSMMAEIWKMNICREHKLPFTEPNWFNDVALARQSISKPSILKLFNREKGIPYERMIKPGNFLLVGYSHGSFGGSETISEFYCRKYLNMGSGYCRNKNGCDYRAECLANLHIIAIAPYAKDKNWMELNWMDKSIKQPISVKVNPPVYECPVTGITEMKPPEPGVTYLKAYRDFIWKHHLRAEVKFDDSDGNPCGKSTKGRLQPCHVEAVAIIHIGKEANTIGNEDDLAILPEETLEEKRLLRYEQERVKRIDIDIKQWEAVREILSEKAKPRKKWYEALEISREHLQRLLGGEYIPSPELYGKILKLCRVEKVSVPDSNIPIPSRLNGQEPGNIYSLFDLCKVLDMSETKGKELFEKWLFRLYDVDYLNVSEPSIRELITKWEMEEINRKAQQKKNDIANLLLVGDKWENDIRKEIVFNIGDIIAVSARKKLGKNGISLQVKLKNQIILTVNKVKNKLAFQLGVLPEPGGMEINENKPSEKYGCTSLFSDWYTYESIPWILFSKLQEHYGVTIEQFQADIKSGKFPAEMMERENGKILVNPVTAWRIYKDGIPVKQMDGSNFLNILDRRKSEVSKIYTAWREQEEEKYREKQTAGYQKIGEDEKKKFRKAVMALGGVKDPDYESLPRWCRRKNGRPLDVMVTELAEAGYYYETANELYEAISRY